MGFRLPSWCRSGLPLVAGSLMTWSCTHVEFTHTAGESVSASLSQTLNGTWQILDDEDSKVYLWLNYHPQTSTYEFWSGENGKMEAQQDQFSVTRLEDGQYVAWFCLPRDLQEQRRFTPYRIVFVHGSNRKLAFIHAANTEHIIRLIEQGQLEGHPLPPISNDDNSHQVTDENLTPHMSRGEFWQTKPTAMIRRVDQSPIPMKR